MEPVAEIEVVQDPDGWRWSVKITDDDPVAQSPSGVYWQDEQASLEAAQLACRVMGGVAGLVNLDVADIAPDEADLDLTLDDDFSASEPIAVAVATELVARQLLPQDWMERRAIDPSVAVVRGLA